MRSRSGAAARSRTDTLHDLVESALRGAGSGRRARPDGGANRGGLVRVERRMHDAVRDRARPAVRARRLGARRAACQSGSSSPDAGAACREASTPSRARAAPRARRERRRARSRRRAPRAGAPRTPAPARALRPARERRRRAGRSARSSSDERASRRARTSSHVTDTSAWKVEKSPARAGPLLNGCRFARRRSCRRALRPAAGPCARPPA